MTFKPRMTSRLHGITILEDLKWRSWNGIVADVWHVACAAGARGEYVSKDARLFVVLEREGGGSSIRLSPRGANLPPAPPANGMSFVPAEMRLWSQIDQPTRVRHLDLHFNAEILSERLGEDLDPVRLATPRLGFFDERLHGLARLIAQECTAPEEHHDLYGDGLTLALFIDLLRLGRAEPPKQTALASWQLRRAMDFLEENCFRNVRLQELAALTGLSQSYFSHSFKAATGYPPYQWHMRARIGRVQDMLTNSDLSLTEVAMRAGFADQAHFTRVFRSIAGETPAAWRRARRPITIGPARPAGGPSRLGASPLVADVKP